MAKPAKTSLPQHTSIVSRWLLDESSGNRADSVGSNTLTDVNTVAAGSGYDGNWANSADFERGNSEKLEIADNASLSITGALTISFLMRSESIAGTQDMVNKSDNDTQKSYRVGLGSDSKIFFTVSSNGTSETNVIQSDTISTGTWYLVTAVYRPSTETELYVNAVSKGSNTSSIPANIFNGTAKFILGNIDNVGYSNYYDGLLQDVIIWSAALSDSEVSDLYILYSTSPSSSVSSSVSASPSSSPSSSVSSSQSSSPSSSASSSVSSSPSSSLSSSVSSSVSSSPSVSPSVGYQEYTRGDEVSLPGNDNNLETNYSAQDTVDVATSDDVRVAQAAEGQYAIHQFKDFVGSENDCTVLCELQSTLAPSLSTVYLQIYNRNSSSWETIDSDNTSAADTDFILTASIPNLTNYKDASNVIACRVYQLAS